MVLLAWVLGCTGEPEGASPSPPLSEETGIDTADTGETVDSACVDPAPIPVEDEYLRGYTGAEDFAFDADGYLVSIDQSGNLVGINQDGGTRVMVAGASAESAGLRFLPDGDIVYCDVTTGSLVRADPETGGTVVILSGLAYPNGLDVGLDGFLYVAEQSGGRVRRVDPETGDYTVIASDLYRPNGITFSPDYQTLYIGSFGAGVIWAIDRNESGEWSAPRVFASTPDAPGVPPDWCDTHAEGEECPGNSGYGLGECAEDSFGSVGCVDNPDLAACEGLAAADACVTERFGEPFPQTCQMGAVGLICPRTPIESTDACASSGEGDPCWLDDKVGTCTLSFEDVLACWSYDDYWVELEAGCSGLALGDECQMREDLYPTVGNCSNGTDYGISGLVCVEGGTGSMRGGLDAINTDACGNLYVSEYVMGVIWRFTGEATEAQRAATLRSQWIPNMHGGTDRGGWDSQVLYVMDRQRGGVFALPVGIEGHRDAYVPP